MDKEPHRVTSWRRRKRKIDALVHQCSCTFHRAAQSTNDEESCNCTIHTLAKSEQLSDSESDCDCEIHLKAAIQLSGHRDTSSSSWLNAAYNDDMFYNIVTPASEDSSNSSSDREENFDPNVSTESNCAGSVIFNYNEEETSSTTGTFSKPAPEDSSNSSSDSEKTVYSDKSSTTRLFLRPHPDSSSSSEEGSESNASSGDDAVQHPPHDRIPLHGDSSGGSDPDDPDDPGDPGDVPDNNENDNNASDSDPDSDLPRGIRIMTFDNALLNAPLQMEADLTTREALSMVLSLADKNNLTYEVMIKIFIIMNTVLGSSTLPATKKQLWSCLIRHAQGIRKHAYCSRCFTALGFIPVLPNPVVCECGWTKAKGKVKYFITLNIRSQLERLLTLPGIWEKLQYPQVRQKAAPDSIEDILDGEAYQRLRAGADGPSPADFTYNFNLDGFKLSDSSKMEAWPIFLRINELPPNLRQKHVILAGLWVDREYVHFNLFMKTFVKQANKLATTGVTCERNGVEVKTRFFPCCCVADSKGRAGILRMSTHSGNFGCTFCEHQGVKLEGSMKYPIPGTLVNRIRRYRRQEFVEQILIQPAALRTDQSIRDLMAEGRRMRGVIGPAQVMLLAHFDLGIGFSTDDLHPIYKGVTDFHTELILESVPNEYSVGVNEIALINQRMQHIMTPTHITRKPRGIDLRHMWKASEWRNWLLFYGVPCMRGIVPDRYVRHFGMLSKAIFLLSRDIITEVHLQDAERSLNEYITQFQRMYGPENMRFNVHILTHLVQCVRCWGPLWSHSTFPFESWNGRLAKKMSSPRGAIDQICMRYLMHSLIASIPADEHISDIVKEIIEQDIIGSKMKNIHVVNSAYFFGQALQRNATEAELLLLEESAYENYYNVIEYTQVKLSGLECRSTSYRLDMESHNCFIYTKDDYFASVDSIVVLSDGGNQVGGLFLTLYEVGDALLAVDHIVPIVNADGKAFETINNIRNLAIKVRIRDHWYITPMHNQCEID